MNAHASPATRLNDVMVINEQTGEQWRAGSGRIDRGRIVVEPARATRPPAGLFGNPEATFTVVARDGGARGRRFDHVIFDPASSDPNHSYVFA
jgi:hypothetical protein